MVRNSSILTSLKKTYIINIYIAIHLFDIADLGFFQ